MCSCSYFKRISILETVSKLKFVTVMLDLECYALVIEMFRHFLKVIRDHHPTEVPQVSRRLAEHVLSNCASKLKTYLTEAVKSSGVSLNMYSNVVASICEGTFSSLKENKVVANPARLFSSVQDLPSKKTSVEENRCAAEAGHRQESCPTKAIKRKKKEISTKKAIPAATTSATKATSEELNTIEAKLTKKCENVASSSTAKPTVPPTKKTTSVKKGT
ncbi:unnamed protein product [Arabis nemorensis]|uniref:Uncharacterized protein n=1 Tax=Arabis nemorensis TaxID=586526 RepID=A0A565CB39_9BRAS|nr:unnamed protein product [Arabis nemorensis]